MPTLPIMGALEGLGRQVGRLLALVTGPGAALRHARFFHPDGDVFRARVVPIADGGRECVVAWRLAGDALVRVSNAWWRDRREWPDVLGVAVRFRSDPELTPEPSPGDQDLLFATVRWPWTTPFAPLATNTHDYIANDYHAVSPFHVLGYGNVKWRLLGPRIATAGDTRLERLESAVEAGEANFRLQLRPQAERTGWADVVEIRLRERVPINQNNLQFQPFRSGRGIRPIGFVHALRVAAYRASQSARPHSNASIRLEDERRTHP